MKNIYDTIVVGNQKAIVAFVLPLVGTYIALVGLSLDMTIGQAVQVLVTAVVASGGVWFKKNK